MHYDGLQNLDKKEYIWLASICMKFKIKQNEYMGIKVRKVIHTWGVEEISWEWELRNILGS